MRRNFRTTREIAEAAGAYLGANLLDTDIVQPDHVHTGPIPAVRFVASLAEETALLATYLRGAAREFRQGMNAWNRGCGKQGAPLHVRIAGLLMLYAARRGARPDGLRSRLVNKWKGWARFRQEPLLLEHTRERSPKLPNDCAA